ncbi:hypothetical protein DPMN_071981 [Dreissena polymorpha]|uniref:Uncharacterized protein n=1 Tax=Dreissena polymorpha TaxID=45954 RepID=A0A9D3Z8P0_DREPO|nr:hypothetical protein DPMN_071981 [Dreissena polymorpha]
MKSLRPIFETLPSPLPGTTTSNWCLWGRSKERSQVRCQGQQPVIGVYGGDLKNAPKSVARDNNQ